MLDELNIIAKGKRQEIINNINNADKCVDIVLDLLILGYIYGNDMANEQLKSDIKPSVDDMQESIYKKVADKTFAERVLEYAESGETDNILRVADTELHRVFNESAYSTAVKAGAKSKRWVCMFENSRDTHMYLHGTVVPIDAEFYTFNGSKALYPGQFGVAEEDINCKCVLEFEK